jgi:uncharacterized damage-inducible protein DinB
VTDFGISWNLSRQRFVDEIKGLSDEQMRWRPYSGALSIGEMGIHVAGVEVFFTSQLSGSELSDLEVRVRSSSTDGVVNDKPFLFADEEISTNLVLKILDNAAEMVTPLMTSPTPDILAKEIQSALGPIITGKGALARFAFHPAYHQGQAYFYKSMPSFPNG